MNVAFGGTLVGHLPDVPGLQVHGVPLDESQTIHDVTPEPGSRLAAVTRRGRSRASHTTTRDRSPRRGSRGDRPDAGRTDRGDRTDRARPRRPAAPACSGTRRRRPSDRQQALFDAVTSLARARASSGRQPLRRGRIRLALLDPQEQPGLGLGIEVGRFRRHLLVTVRDVDELVERRRRQRERRPAVGVDAPGQLLQRHGVGDELETRISAEPNPKIGSSTSRWSTETSREPTPRSSVVGGTSRNQRPPA